MREQQRAVRQARAYAGSARCAVTYAVLWLEYSIHLRARRADISHPLWLRSRLLVVNAIVQRAYDENHR